MTDNPMDQIDKLAEIVNEVLTPLGLTMHMFGALAKDPNNPLSEHGIQGIWVLDPEIAFKTVEEREMDAQFAEIARQEAAREVTEKVADKISKIKTKHTPAPKGPPPEKREYKGVDDMLGGIDT